MVPAPPHLKNGLEDCQKERDTGIGVSSVLECWIAGGAIPASFWARVRTLPPANQSGRPRDNRTPSAGRQAGSNRNVSIRAPRVGGRPYMEQVVWWSSWFQSAPPAWGGDWAAAMRSLKSAVSIRAPRVGGRREPRENSRSFDQFQSAPPAWGGDPEPLGLLFAHDVSIRAPRVGGRRRAPVCAVEI